VTGLRRRVALGLLAASITCYALALLLCALWTGRL